MQHDEIGAEHTVKLKRRRRRAADKGLGSRTKGIHLPIEIIDRLVAYAEMECFTQGSVVAMCIDAVLPPMEEIEATRQARAADI